mmetsp:Transcript_19386/g.41962  ORF Transcript_19386/g.41962 Transcript_19386/m.41962 type:complete len:220 (+) Transcript_19386:574-1233(+)
MSKSMCHAKVLLDGAGAVDGYVMGVWSTTMGLFTSISTALKLKIAEAGADEDPALDATYVHIACITAHNLCAQHFMQRIMDKPTFHMPLSTAAAMLGYCLGQLVDKQCGTSGYSSRDESSSSSSSSSGRGESSDGTAEICSRAEGVSSDDSALGMPLHELLLLHLSALITFHEAARVMRQLPAALIKDVVMEQEGDEVALHFSPSPAYDSGQSDVQMMF